MSRIDYGQVDVQLGDDVYTLKPTLNACQKVEGRWGSIIGAAEVCQTMKMSIADIAFVIMAGAGLGQRQKNDIEQAVFDAGQLDVLSEVAKYLGLLLNPTGKEDDEEPPEGE